jgi:hypothetical protein
LLIAAQEIIEELEEIQKKTAFYLQLQMKPDRSIRFYTGFPSFNILVATFNALRPTAEKMYSWSQMQRVRSKGLTDVEKLRNTLRSCKLSLFDQFYFFLQKLRVGTLNQVLSDRYFKPGIVCGNS